VLHPVIALDLMHAVRADRLEAASQDRLAASARHDEAALEPTIRIGTDNDVVRFGNRYLREAGDRIAA
jgi:hypothetical protein